MTLELSRLTRRFTDYPALDDVSLEIPPGEFLALLGPSGSGKTTLLRILAGLDYPESGSVRREGRDLLALDARRRKVGLVFQHYALFRHLTVADNVAFGLRVRPWRTRPKRADIAARVERLLRRVQLQDMATRYPAQLSGGQRQRVALGRAIVREPAAFLFDEPLSNLDARLRVATRAELARLHQRLGATMVYVTHDQVEAMTLGTRVAVMHEGVLQQVAAPMTLYREPANVFVAGFIGTPQMNFLRTTRDGAEVLLGIRAQDLAIARADDDSVLARGSVWLVEALGSEQIVHVSGGDAPDLVVVVSASQRVRVGDEIELRANERAVHVFDATSGARILI
jgi:sulfate transport system ATP-binding protein